MKRHWIWASLVKFDLLYLELTGEQYSNTFTSFSTINRSFKEILMFKTRIMCVHPHILSDSDATPINLSSFSCFFHKSLKRIKVYRTRAATLVNWRGQPNRMVKKRDSCLLRVFYPNSRSFNCLRLSGLKENPKERRRRRGVATSSKNR